MRPIDHDDLVKLLLSIDRHLADPSSILIIGGSAITLAYNVEELSYDIDTSGHVTPEVMDAFHKAVAETGVKTTLSPAGVEEFPYHYEERVITSDLPLKKLKVRLPEKHDLVLSKVIRGWEKDMVAIQKLERKSGLDKDLLLDRFIKEMDHVTGNPKTLQMNFLSLIERLWGTEESKRVKKLLKK